MSDQPKFVVTVEFGGHRGTWFFEINEDLNEKVNALEELLGEPDKYETDPDALSLATMTFKLL